MPKPKTSPDLTPKPYRLLKTDLAAKLSARSTGGITYLLLADTSDTPELHLAVTANEGGGLWSKETVRLDTIEDVLDAYDGQPFPTKALRGAMVGQSSNNPPFCLAVLKDLGLAAPAPDKAHQHVKAGDWNAFRQEWLAKPGEPVIYPAPKAEEEQAGEAESLPTDPWVGAVLSEQSPSTKGKKRRKAPDEEAERAVDADRTEDVSALTDNALLPREAEHAPPEHA